VTRYLLDTNIISDVIKPEPSKSSLAWMGTQRDDDLFIATLTIAEIRPGISEKPKGKKRNALDAWFAKAVPGATAPDILRLALAFPETTDGKRYRAAAAVLRKDGVQAQKAKDAAFVAREEAIKMLKPFSRLAGGFHVEVSAGMEGPKVALSKELREAREFVDRLTVAVAPALRDFSCSPTGDSLKSWPN
jgi:predicted nucleic acid-binding protein